MNFSDLKKKSNSALENLVKNLEAKTYGDSDTRFWTPVQDKKTGLGSAVIRFLPTAPDNDAPWIKVHQHGFKNELTGKWFIEECPSTIGQNCPVCSEISPLWAGSEADKAIARQRKRKTNYIANILVIKDPANPENEGQTKLFKFGKQIFDKIIAMVKPEFSDQDPVNVFDFWTGADFRLRISQNTGGYRTYEKSEFDRPSALFDGDDDKLEALWNGQFNLKEFLEPTRFRGEDELRTRYAAVVNGGQPMATSAANRVLDELESGVAEQPKFRSEAPRTPAPAKVEIPDVGGGDDFDDLDSILNDL